MLLMLAIWSNKRIEQAGEALLSKIQSALLGDFIMKRKKIISLKERNRRLKQSQEDSGLEVYTDGDGERFLFRPLKNKKGFKVDYV